jgi:hypothetical protein
LAGWCVFRRRDDRLVWGDALFHPRHDGAAESLLAAAVRLPDLAGARQLETWFSPRLCPTGHCLLIDLTEEIGCLLKQVGEFLDILLKRPGVRRLEQPAFR